MNDEIEYGEGSGPEKLDLTTPNFGNQNIARIAELFPNVVTESRDKNDNVKHAIDFDALRQELSDEEIVEGPQERYHLNWPGKRKAMLAANAPINKTLRPVREESVDFDTTKNLFIEGDNLDALKLLQETYLGKVKMIYIDPPYNTGKDFIYNDNFTVESDDYLEESGQRDEKGGRLVANPESNGRYHSDWLSMMYPRLKLARNLLRDDGVIFISIDDNEIENLKTLGKQVFGADLLLGTILWKKKTNGNNMGHIPPVHDYIVCFGKSDAQKSILGFPLTDAYIEANYSNPDDDQRGRWTTSDLSANHEGPYFPIKNENTGEIYYPADGRYWVFNEKEVKRRIADGRIIFGKTGKAGPIQKKFLKERDDMRFKPESWWDNHGLNADGMADLAALMGEKKLFDHPKPIKLLCHLIDIASQEDDVILDFFAGSAPVYQAAFEQNLKDGSNRNVIGVQMAEKCGEKSSARKAGYGTVAEISKERIRRAGTKILEENPDQVGKLDIGFRTLKIASSNMTDVWHSPESVSQGDLLSQVSNIKSDRTGEDLLFQVLLDWGVDLTLPIARESIEGKEMFFVDGDALAACFETGVSEVLVKQIVDRKPLRAVFRDDGFANSDGTGDATKINVEQLFKHLSPHTEVKVI